MRDYHNSATIYVSCAHGNDEYSGYQPHADGYGNGPVRTLERAIYMIHTMRVAGVYHPVTVCFTDDYYTEKTAVLGADGFDRNNSKSHKCDNITLTSYKEPVRFIGGRKLCGFKRDTFNGVNCFSLFIPDVKDGKYRFSDLYVNGKPASLTRYPKRDTLQAVTTEYPEVEGMFYKGSKWFIAHKEDLENIDGVENAILSFYHFWIDEHTPIESYDRQTGKVVLKNRSRFNISTQYEPDHTSALHYYLENVAQTFESPNEWYLDITNGMLYYIPENDGISPEDIEVFAPSVQTLISVRGTPENDAVGIRIENIDFICTKGDYVSRRFHVVDFIEGEDGYAADEQAAVGVHGAVEFKYAQACGVENCSFNCIGGYAVNILDGCNAVRVEDCNMTYLGGGGVKIYGDETETTKTGNCIIRSNKIYKGGMRHAAACGITVCHSANNEISDNEISYLDYSGVSVGWVWGYHKNLCYGNIIKNNHVHHIGMGRLSDMGGIYLLGPQTGTVVKGNLIHDVNSAHYGGWGIYLDEGSMYVTVSDNTVYNTKCHCFHQHYGAHNVLKNNTFAFGGDAVIYVSRREEHTALIMENNHLISNGKPIYHNRSKNYPNLGIKTNSNRVWDTTGAPVMFKNESTGKTFSLEEWQNVYGMDEGTVIETPNQSILDKE